MLKLQVIFLVVAALWAAPQGVVISKIGDAFINGKIVKVGKRIKAGDTLKTGAESSLEIRLQEGTGFHLKENSSLLIEKYEFEKREASLALLKGHLQSVIQTGDTYKVRGSTATAAVRGTVFFTAVDDSSTYHCTCEGSVDFTAHGRETHPVAAKHHRALRAYDSGKVSIQEMKYHNDSEIESLRQHLKTLGDK